MIPGWYIATTSRHRTSKPVRVRLDGTSWVLVPTGQGQRLLQDRCPHRNAPLSMGRLTSAGIQCGYHGWEFDSAGRCVRVPSLGEENKIPRVSVPSLPLRESQGYLWAWVGSAEPTGDLFSFPYVDDGRYATFRHQTSLDASLENALENILDVPHTSYLHRSLFRTEPRHSITATVRSISGGIEAEYRGETLPAGILPRILSTSGRSLFHADRFFGPNIAQVEYRAGESHMIATSALTPESAQRLRLYSVVTTRLPIPSFFLRTFGVILARLILRQDKKMLRAQRETIRDFGGERFTSTTSDVLGPRIRAWLKAPGEFAPLDEKIYLKA